MEETNHTRLVSTGLEINHLYLLHVCMHQISDKDCVVLTESIKARLHHWSTKSLSYAGRLELIRAVIFSINNYWCRQLFLPYSVLKRVEQLCSRFFWKGADKTTSGARVVWQNICSLKSEGGLGIKDLKTCYKAYSFLERKAESKEMHSKTEGDENYITGYDEECLQMLFYREMSFGFKKSESLVLCNYLKSARLEAITWILRARAAFGFRFQTAYLSMTYFDRFLSRKSIDSEKSWAMQLLSIACLSLAAKMEEMEVPALSEFQIEGCNFDTKTIQRMELLVLNTLEWKMSLVTPFAFLHFFIWEMCKSSPPDMKVITHLILFTIKGSCHSRHQYFESVQILSELIFLSCVCLNIEVNVMEHRPSVVAVAAILRALNQRLTRKALEYTMNSVSFCGFLEIEGVFTCYNLMQKLEMREFDMQTSVNLPDLSPTRATDAMVYSSTSAKRRRLTK
ncbi:cyclin-D1-1-like [Hibiscus syriacus]|uniref:cyclin-D1-1-like n=1 Tax=Hibiscus syriacus TaxID=106335 RepID=UPI0019238BCC|nr:cyclin-D1-1-like [Hibiscus syriacus]